MKTTTISCDVCKAINTGITEAKVIQVIFVTEQTEGRGVEPYLTEERIDICYECLAKILEGNYLFAHGAQGHNTYFFKGEQK